MRRLLRFKWLIGLTALLAPFLGPCGGLSALALAGGCVAEGGGWTIKAGSPFEVSWTQHKDGRGEYKNRVSFDPEGAGIVHAFLGDKTSKDETSMPVVILDDSETLGDGGSSSVNND